MRQGSFFSSVLYLFVIIFLAAEGLVFLSFCWFDNLSEYFANLMLYQRESFLSLGIILISIAFVLLLAFYRIYGHKYITVSSKIPSCEVDVNILTTYAKKYFEELFNRDVLDTEVIIFRKRIEIVAYLSSNKNNNKLDLAYFLDKSRLDFRNLLRDKFAYTGNFNITIKTT